MADSNQLRKISQARLLSAETLISAKDWYGATYMMGYVLECALKAATCKTLHLGSYPSGTQNKKIDGYFRTHNFDQLLVVSGMSDIFNFSGDVEIFKNWSEFTQNFPGDWTSARYDADRQDQWDEKKTKKLYNNLTNEQHGILIVINNKKRW